MHDPLLTTGVNIHFGCQKSIWGEGAVSGRLIKKEFTDCTRVELLEQWEHAFNL
jgi:hypothetical protein